MAARVDSFDRADRLTPAFVKSLIFHALIIGGVIAWGIWTFGNKESWGDPNANPGAGFAITPTKTIPMPMRQSRPNPVANDSESQVARVDPSDRDQEKRPKEDKDAIELNTKNKKRQADRPTSNYRYRPSEELRNNQLRTTTGQAMSNPMYGTQGAGGVGVNTGTPFGTRFGGYADMIRRRVSEKWRTNDVDPYIRNAKPLTVSFEILRNGTVRNVMIVQRSGVLSLDYSGQRAIQEAAPFEPLPREYNRDSATVELTFQLQR